MAVNEPFPYCGAPAVPDDLLMRWNGDPVLIATLALGMALHWRFSERLARRPGLFLLGWGLVGFVFISPLCALASALFAARSAHHMLLIAVIPPLLLMGGPLSRFCVGGGGLLGAALLHALVLWAWHAPPAYAAALADMGVYWVMQLTLLGSALLVWQGVLGRSASPAAVAGAMAGTFMQTAMLGAVLAFAATPLYAYHALTAPFWGLSQLADQQLAGALMWTLGGVPYLWAALAAVLRLADSAPSAAAGRAV